MKVLACVAFAAATLMSTSAMAQVYGSVGYSNLSFSEEEIEGNIGLATGRIGTHFTPNIGAEVEGAFGLSDATVEIEGIDVDLSVKYSVAAYLVGFWPVNENFEVLGRVGLATAEVEAEALGETVTDSGSGIQYGVGAQYFFAPNHGIRADYTRSEAIESNIFSIAYAFRF
jgi:opacity protein-like surface antigen